jgi:hypothetical protein
MNSQKFTLEKSTILMKIDRITEVHLPQNAKRGYNKALDSDQDNMLRQYIDFLFYYCLDNDIINA